MKIDVRIIYGKSELEPAENNWLKSLNSIRTSFCQNLHAKCYLSENEVIITSMNLYEFSQINNNEMGVYIVKAEDEQLYDEVLTEAMRLVRISDEIKVSVAKVPKDVEKPAKKAIKQGLNVAGFCIRCGEKLKLNPMVPYCPKCFKSWKKYKNEEHEEKYCHICGKPNKSSLIKPSCYECYTINKNVLEFPLA